MGITDSSGIESSVSRHLRKMRIRRRIAQVLTVCVLSGVCHPNVSVRPSVSSDGQLSASDQALPEDLEHRAFLYFFEQGDPGTGLVRDRARNGRSPMDDTHKNKNVASIAATGFGLTVLCIAANRGWMDPNQVRGRVRATLRFLARRAPRVHGWYYHWMNAITGAREWHSEISSIDSALLLAGVLAVRGYYRDDTEIQHLASMIYNRVDFEWMLNGHPTLLSHGWKPETGFLPYRWDTYSEESILYLLAIGSRTHPIPAESWYAWRRDPVVYDGYRYIGTGPLFTHQYSQAWVDLRGLKEARAPYVDYFANSIAATRANRLLCINLSSKFHGYDDNVWGITASDSSKGYVAWGGPPPSPDIDGTVVPCAAGGSLMFAPDICLPALRAMRQVYGERIYGRYGFADAFNPNTGWVDSDVIGIDLGITILSAENLRSGSVWGWIARSPEIRRAILLAGLSPSLTQKAR